jgi:hypothetical protein
MVRLNGWQRIGVLLSVVWIVVGCLYIRSVVMDTLGAPAVYQLRACLDAHSTKPDGTVPADTDWGPCNRRFEAEWKREVQDNYVNGLAAVWTGGLLAAAWLLVYVLVGLIRWIGARFATK